MHTLRKIFTRERAYEVTALLIATLFAVLYIIMPRGADDLSFLAGYPPEASLPEAWGNLLQESAKRWLTETGRLGNFFALGFLFLLPKPVFGLLTGGIIYLMLRLMPALAGVRRGSLLSWLLMAVGVLVLPWYDYLLLTAYSVNYVWAGTFMLGFLYLYLHPGLVGGLRIAGLCVLGFVAGWMHEAYGAPACVALTLWLILRRRQLSARYILPYLSLGLGSAMTLLSPTFWQRTEVRSVITDFPLTEALMQLGPAALLLGIYLGALLLAVMKGVWRRGSAENLLFAAYIAVALVIFLKFWCGARSGMPLMLMSAVGAARLLGSCRLRSAGWVKTSVGVLTALCCLLNLSCAIRMQTRLTREYNDVVRLYRNSPTGTFYYDISYPRPDATLFKTSVRWFHEKTPIYFWEQYYGPGKHLVILPEAMRGFAGHGVRSRYIPGAVIYNGWIVLPADFNREEVVRFIVLTPDGRSLPSRYRADRFRAEDGREYTLITPHVKVLDKSLKITDAQTEKRGG